MESALHTVIETAAFLSKAAKIMSEEERAEIVDAIAANPAAGVLIKGTGRLRKLRMPLQGRGKRGGARVIYWFHSDRFPAALLWVFAKNEADDLTKAQEATLAKLANALISDLGG